MKKTQKANEDDGAKSTICEIARGTGFAQEQEASYSEPQTPSGDAVLTKDTRGLHTCLKTRSNSKGRGSGCSSSKVGHAVSFPVAKPRSIKSRAFQMDKSDPRQAEKAKSYANLPPSKNSERVRAEEEIREDKVAQKKAAKQEESWARKGAEAASGEI